MRRLAAAISADALVQQVRCTQIQHERPSALSDLEVIRELAGHVDGRTTQIYVDVPDQRKDDGIAALERAPHPLAV